MANEKTVFEVKERNSQEKNESSLSSFSGFKGMIEDYLKVRDYT